MNTQTTSTIKTQAIAPGYLSIVLLFSIPLWIGFFGQFALFIAPYLKFPIEAVTTAILYALAVHFAIQAIKSSSLGSRAFAIFTLLCALFFPLMLHTILA